MTYRGILRQKPYKDGIHYGIFQKGNYYDFMDNFNCQLMDRVKLRIIADKRNVFDEEGKLLRIKDLNGKYHYKINKKSIDDVLKESLEAYVEIEMENITPEYLREVVS
jgi:hypothetical protein